MKIFAAATREEIERQFNLWAAGLVQGVQMPGVGATQKDGDGGWMKEVLYVLPAVSNARIAVPTLREVPH
jgi:hypothetical protein